MITNERISELLDYVELVLGWDPIGASDLRSDFIQWAHGFDDENQSAEDAVAAFETSPVYFQYYPSHSGNSVDGSREPIYQPIFTTLSLQDGVRILVSSKQVSIEAAKTIFMIALSDNILSQNNKWELVAGTTSLDDFLQTELKKLDVEQTLAYFRKEATLISKINSLLL